MCPIPAELVTVDFLKKIFFWCHSIFSIALCGEFVITIYLFWPHHEACGVWVPCPGIKPESTAVKVLTTGPPGNSHDHHLAEGETETHNIQTTCPEVHRSVKPGLNP